MKYFSVLFFTFFLCGEMLAQDVSSPKAIPAMPNPNLTLPNITPEKKPSIFDVKPKNDVPDLWSNKSKVNVVKEEFANPGDRFTKKLNKTNFTEGDAVDMKIFRRNQYFGDYRTKSEKLKIVYRDPALVDGDILKILVNDVIVKHGIYLAADYEGFDLRLVEGFNKIEFIAVNEGTSSPNTGEFRILDKEFEVTANQWNVATGFKASFIVIKE